MASRREGQRGAISPKIGDARMLALMTDAFGGYGGIAQYNRDFLGAVSRSELFQSALVLPRVAPLPHGELPPSVKQVGAIRGRLAYAARALLAALRDRPTVIVNAHLFHGPLAQFLARLTGARLVSQLHGTEVWQPMSRLCRKALEASDLVLTVSRDTRARVLAQVRIAPEKVVVVNNTVGDVFCPGDRKRARQRLGLGDEFVILTVARLDERVDDQGGYKGHERVIRQIPQLLAQGHSVTYLVAGLGPARERLERLADELGVGKNIRFLGMVSIDDLPDLYRAADLFALPSTGEGFGIAFLEAMACGTPAIGLAVGGAPDALGDGFLGICVSPEEFPEALAAVLQQGRTVGNDLPDLVQERFGRVGFNMALANHLAVMLAPGSSEQQPG